MKISSPYNVLSLVMSNLSPRHYTSSLSQADPWVSCDLDPSQSVHSFEVCCFLFLEERHAHRSFLVFQISSKTATTLLQRPLYLALSYTCHIKLTSNKNRVGETATNLTFTF